MQVTGGSSSPAGGHATLTDADWSNELNLNLLRLPEVTSAKISRS